MPSLREIQEQFQDYLLTHESPIAEHIVQPENMPAKGRLDVYWKGYALRLIEMLGKDFPILRKLMGAKPFDDFCREYINAHPSKHFSIRYFSRHFIDMLKSNTDLHPTLEEMARFEWSIETALDAPDAELLTFDTLAAMPPESWETLTLTFHPSFQTQIFNWNTPELWKAIDAEETENTNSFATMTTLTIMRFLMTMVR